MKPPGGNVFSALLLTMRLSRVDRTSQLSHPSLLDSQSFDSSLEQQYLLNDYFQSVHSEIYTHTHIYTHILMKQAT